MRAEGSQNAERVVIINDRSHRVGGASMLACDLAAGLEADGVQVTFLAGDAAHGAPPVEDTVFVGDAPLTQRSRADAFSRGLWNPSAFAALSRIIARADTPRTIYHVHGWSQILSPSIFRLLAPLRPRVLLHAHDYFLACPNGGFIDHPLKRVCHRDPLSAACLTARCDKRSRAEKMWRVARHGLRERLYPLRGRPADIVMIHEGMQPYLARAGIGGRGLRTVRNPVVPFLSTPGRPSASNRFFFVGRLEPEKGCRLAAQAAQRAGVPMHFIGDGVGKAELARCFPDAVLHGWLDRSAIAGELMNARALVLSSLTPEPFGLVVAEAVRSGLPVVVPDASLLAPEVAAAGCGLVYKAGNAESLGKAMARISRDDALVEKMSAAALHRTPAMATTHDGWMMELKQIYAEMLVNAPTAQLDRSNLADVVRPLPA